MSRARRSLLLLLVAGAMAGEELGTKEPGNFSLYQNETTTHANELGPEYHHPDGVEAFDPYNSEKSFHRPEDDEDEPEQETEDNGDDELPELGGDHLLEGMADNLPIFLLEPEDAFAVRSKPATLKCRTANALDLYFRCNGARVTASQHLEHVDPQSGVRVVEVEYNVTRDRLEEYFGETFQCDCVAWSSRGQFRSRSAKVESAFIKKQFTLSPAMLTVEESQAASLRCVPPPAAPPPCVTWLKHGAPLQQDHNVVVSADGNLLISRASLQDTANYTCVAENIAGKRVSDPALLTVYLNGGWSAWGPWTSCRCGGRVTSGQRRSRTCTEPQPLNGGAPCQGQAVQRTADCLPCQSAMPGRWGAWSEWSECVECAQVRRRQCAGVSSDACDGLAEQRAPCAPATAACAALYDSREETVARDYIPMYVGIAVAVLVFLTGAVLIYALFRKRTRNTLYTMARSDIPPDMFPVVDKKVGVNPGLTQPCYDYAPSSEGCLEHHYDVPHLTSGYASPVDNQIMPYSSIESDEYESKPCSRSNNSGSSCFTSTGSTYDACVESVPLQLAEMASSSATSASLAVSGAGARLVLPAAAVALSVPEGALHRSRLEQLYLTVVRDDRYRPVLAGGLTQLSPVIKCGPPRLQLDKPFVLQMPHCALIEHGFWKLYLYGTENSFTSDKCLPRWKKMSTLGQETVNTPVFTQVDENSAFVISDVLSTFTLVGESLGGMAVKSLKLTVHYNLLSHSNSQCEVKLSIFDDTPCNLLLCQKKEEVDGGMLLAEPKNLYFQDGETNLSIDLENINPAWRLISGNSKIQTNFSEIWNARNNIVQHKYIFEQTDRNYKLECKISAYQKTNPLFKQSLQIKLPVESLTTSDQRPFDKHSRNINITEKVLESRTLPERPKQDKNDNLRHKSLTVNDVGVNSPVDTPFRLNVRVKKQLCTLLDPPRTRGNDWRMLAQRLNVDRYITWFATKGSPTESILDLWECRNRAAGALSELAELLRSMDRLDAADLLAQSIENSWL